MDILKAIYREIFTLEQWIRHIDVDNIFEKTLLETTDSDSYIQLLSTSLVACTQEARQLLQPLCLTQTSHQREVILRVIERIRRRDGTEKNVLTFGFGSMSDDPNAQISSLPNIEYRYPNSSVNRLHFGAWKKLHNRVGDAVMEHLLELTSVFLFVSPSCYVQLTGQPVFDILATTIGKQKPIHPINNIIGGSNILQTLRKQICGKMSKAKCTKKEFGKQSRKEKHNGTKSPEDISDKDIISDKIKQLNNIFCDDLKDQTGSCFADCVIHQKCESNLKKRNLKELYPEGEKDKHDMILVCKKRKLTETQSGSEIMDEKLHCQRLPLNDYSLSQFHGCTLTESHTIGEYGTSSCQGQTLKYNLTLSDISASTEYSNSQCQAHSSIDFPSNDSRESSQAQGHSVTNFPSNDCPGSSQGQGDSVADFTSNERPVVHPFENSEITGQPMRYFTHNPVENVHDNYSQSQVGNVNVCKRKIEEQQERGIQIELIKKQCLQQESFHEQEKSGEHFSVNLEEDGIVCGAQQNSETKKKRKCRRGKKRKKQKLDKNQIPHFLPYNYHTYFCRSDYMYAKRLREQLPKTFILGSLDDTEEGVDKLFSTIFKQQIIADSSLKLTINVFDSCDRHLSHIEKVSEKGNQAQSYRKNCSQNKIKEEVQIPENVMQLGKQDKLNEENKLSDQNGICELNNTFTVNKQMISEADGKVVAGYKQPTIKRDTSKQCQELHFDHESFFGSHHLKGIFLDEREGHVLKNESGLVKNESSPGKNNVTNDTKETYVSSGEQFGEKTNELLLRLNSYQINVDKKESQEEDASYILGLQNSPKERPEEFRMMMTNKNGGYPTNKKQGIVKAISKKKCNSSNQSSVESETQSQNEILYSDEFIKTKSSVNVSQFLVKSSSIESNYSIQEIVSTNSAGCISNERSSVEILASDTPSEPSKETFHKVQHAKISEKDQESLIASTPLEIIETECLKHKMEDFTTGSLEQNDISHIKCLSASQEANHSSTKQSVQPKCNKITDVYIKDTDNYEVASTDNKLYKTLLPRMEIPVLLKGDPPQYVSINQGKEEKQMDMKNISCESEHGYIRNESEYSRENNYTDEINITKPKIEVDRDVNVSKELEEGEERLNLNKEEFKSLDVAIEESANCSQNITTVEITLHQQIKYILRKMICNHRKCHYNVWLKYYCPLKSQKRRTHLNDRKTVQQKPKLTGKVLKRGENSSKSVELLILRRKRKTQRTSIPSILDDFVPNRKIYLFLRTIIKLIVPEELLGSAANRNLLYRNIKHLISLRRYDKYCLGQLMSGLKTKHMEWLKHVPDQCMKLHLAADIMYWLMNSFIMVLLKSYFYITESTVFRNRLFYYRKKVWSKLHFQALSELRKKGMLQLMKKKEVDETLSHGLSLGVASLRFLPKARSVRPVVNMGRQPLPSCKHNLPVNKQLLNFLNVLTYLKMQHPECIGASKFGIDEIYTSWKAFVKKWKSLEERRPLYFVKTDIKNCFDEINQEKLYSIIDGFLKQSGEEEFVVRRFCSIVMSAGRLKRRFHRKVCGLDQYTPDFVKYIRGQVIEENLRNIILIDQVTNQHEFVTDLLQQLHSLLFHNIIQIGKQYFHQKHGISQGSVISTLLCNIYYGQMEARMMNVRDEELLMRIVDDTLFVTPDKNRAIEFLIKMFKGDSEFNFTTNVQKTLINFAHVDDKHGRIPYCNGDWFPWCGFLFNCQTLDVSNDFTRYKGIAITDTITVDLTCRAGKAMKNKLLISLRPKCHALLLDLQINSCAVVITNCYKLFLLTAFKFHCYACHLPYKQRVQDNPAYFLEMILDIASYFYTQILVQANHKFWSEMVLNLSGKTIQWLCLKAFQLKLSQHHSSYKVLLKKMSEIRKIVQKKLKRQDSDLFPVLEELCGDQLPVEFHELV